MSELDSMFRQWTIALENLNGIPSFVEIEGPALWQDSYSFWRRSELDDRRKKLLSSNWGACPFHWDMTRGHAAFATGLWNSRHDPIETAAMWHAGIIHGITRDAPSSWNGAPHILCDEVQMELIPTLGPNLFHYNADTMPEMTSRDHPPRTRFELERLIIMNTVLIDYAWCLVHVRASK